MATMATMTYGFESSLEHGSSCGPAFARNAYPEERATVPSGNASVNDQGKYNGKGE
jgi:hypothetical protein